MCYCNESPWFEQLRAVPLRRRVWSCLLVTFIHDFFCGCGNCKVKFINSWLFPREEMWKGRAVLKRLLMLHQPWAGESCCTCQRPFVQLSLHSAADAPHTLAGVKCCQAHLWPSVKGHDMRICIVGRIHEFELCFCPPRHRSCRHSLWLYRTQFPCNLFDTIIVINSHIRTSDVIQ